MRATLTLDSDVAERVRREMRRMGKGLQAVINEALRRGLDHPGKRARPPRSEVRPHSFGLRPGADRDRLTQIVDGLEAGETVRKLR